jgi:Na+/proline symporter
MALGPWFTSFVGVFLGTVGVAILADEDGNLTTPANPFGAIIEEIMKLGGFAKVTGTIAITASLAAIMSTADSLIIAISQLVTVDLIYPLRPNASTGEMTLVGKGVSLVAVVLSVVVGLFWDDGTISTMHKERFNAKFSHTF